MTYGRLIYGNNPHRGRYQLVNIGDFFQTFALDELLNECGIPTDSLVNVKRYRIREARDMTLPLVGVFTRMKGKNAFPLPPSVQPLFFGYNNRFSINRPEYLAYRKVDIIGCRDEATTVRIRKKGLPAYLVGCATLALKARKQTPVDPKVFLVDIPAKLEPFIPEDLKKNAVRLTHEVSLPGNNTPETLRKFEAYTKDRLTQYKEQAGLVITCRLHCAAPCLAMGIPVILAREYFDERYGFIDKFLTLYTPDQFDKIDWSPKAPDLAEVKKLLRDAFCALVSNSPNKKEAFEALDAFYMQRERAVYNTPLKTRLFFWGLRFFPYFTTTLRNKWLKRFSVLGEK